VPTPLSETHISCFDRAKVQAKRWRRLVVRAGVGVYRAFERFVWNPFEVLTVFVRRLTIPLVDEDTWDKNLVVVCLPFAMLLFGVSVFSFSVEDPVFLVTVVVVGGVFSAIVEYSTSPLAPPEGWQLAPSICVAFVMSVIWIMNIANEVLAVLETLGELWHLQLRLGRVGKLLYCCWNLDNYIKTDLDTSLLVLEWSNSIGDLVSNMAMASRRCDDGLRWVLCRTHVQSACWHWPPSFFAARSPWASRLRWST
jgi:hypothetical protein